MTSRALFLISCASSMTIWGANNSAVQGPVTGYIFDPGTRAIRQMTGMPGAAYLGAAVVPNVDSAFVSPDGSAAFAVQAGRLVLYTGLTNVSPASVALRGLITTDRVAWAPGATAAAIYSSKYRQAQIVSDLLQTPSVGAPIDLSALSGEVAALAFDGKQIILAVASSGSGGIYTVTPLSIPQRIASAVSPSAISLAGADLYFVDRQTQQIWQIQSYAQQPAPLLFASDASLSSPVGLQLSADNTRLYVAGAGNSAVAVYDVAARSQIQSIALKFTPTRLDRFGASSVFLLNTVGQGQAPLYVLSDANAAKLAVYFVPAADASSRGPMRYRPN